MAEVETFKPRLSKTEKQKSFFGFIVAVLGFIFTTQLLRMLIVQYKYPTFLNTKFAFSLDVPIAVIYILYFVVFALIVNYLRHHRDTLTKLMRIGFALIISGGLANLGERLFLGHVVDYIFIFGGVLNLADCFIFLGVAFVIFSRPNSENF